MQYFLNAKATLLALRAHTISEEHSHKYIRTCT